MILIVDDKQENVFALKKLLQLSMYDVDSANSGEEALKKILKNEYTLIILDVQMPEMDGYEVAEAITSYSKTKNIPIIFLSAVNIDKRFISKGYASGGVDYVTKPFDADLLLLKVKTFCRLYEQHRELHKMQEKLQEEIETRKSAQKALLESNDQLETKVKQRTSELLQINKMLETSNSELEQYAFAASHDLQEPLRKIITFGHMAEQHLKDNSPEAGKYMSKIIASSERMRSLISDLLNYSGLSASTHFSKTDLNQVLRETVNDFDLIITEKAANLSIGSFPTLEAIPAQMRQLFQNLISNSLKFSRKDVAPKIKIWSEEAVETNENKTGRSVRIFVEDNGIGFNEIYRDKIFTMFQRLHRKELFQGTGIGLAIVKKIVEKHGGSLMVNSKENEGTLFTIMLPLEQPVVEQISEPV